MLFLFRSAPEVEKRMHSKLFRKFWRSRGTKEPAYITVPYLQISVHLGIPDVLVDPKIGYEPQEAEVDIRVQCIREEVPHQRTLELQSRERCWMTIMTYYWLLTWKKSRFGIASAIAQTLLEWSPQSQTMRAMLNDLENDQEKRTKKEGFWK